ncbi:MAG: hypothetical protein M5U34_20170 [Chloroflexi bacterium]|nr:hypothetical protein [Chloroflexota bacterium]
MIGKRWRRLAGLVRRNRASGYRFTGAARRKEEFDLETPAQDIPDWLQADSAGTDMLASPKPVESETDLPDWLLGAEQPQPGDKPGEPTPTEAASTRSLTDWLSEFDEEAPAAAPQATLEDDDQPIESQTPKTLTNWLADFEDAEKRCG